MCGVSLECRWNVRVVEDSRHTSDLGDELAGLDVPETNGAGLPELATAEAHPTTLDRQHLHAAQEHSADRCHGLASCSVKKMNGQPLGKKVMAKWW